jgi:hypothetical protein
VSKARERLFSILAIAHLLADTEGADPPPLICCVARYLTPGSDLATPCTLPAGHDGPHDFGGGT